MLHSALRPPPVPLSSSVSLFVSLLLLLHFCFCLSFFLSPFQKFHEVHFPFLQCYFLAHWFLFLFLSVYVFPYLFLCSYFIYPFLLSPPPLRKTCYTLSVLAITILHVRQISLLPILNLFRLLFDLIIFCNFTTWIIIFFIQCRICALKKLNTCTLIAWGLFATAKLVRPTNFSRLWTCAAVLLWQLGFAINLAARVQLVLGLSPNLLISTTTNWLKDFNFFVYLFESFGPVPERNRNGYNPDADVDSRRCIGNKYRGIKMDIRIPGQIFAGFGQISIEQLVNWPRMLLNVPLLCRLIPIKSIIRSVLWRKMARRSSAPPPLRGEWDGQ
jgi:hypothetical protein